MNQPRYNSSHHKHRKIGVGSVMSDINWAMVGSASVLAGILSILTSIAGLPEVEE